MGSSSTGGEDGGKTAGKTAAIAEDMTDMVQAAEAAEEAEAAEVVAREGGDGTVSVECGDGGSGGEEAVFFSAPDCCRAQVGTLSHTGAVEFLRKTVRTVKKLCGPLQRQQ